MAIDSASSPLPHAPIPGPNYAYWGGPNLYVNLTSRCSASCVFCIHNFTWDIFGYDLHLAPGEEPDAAQVVTAVELALQDRAPLEVVFTGLGEPTLRLDVLVEAVSAVSRLGLRTRLDTNGHGQLLNPGRDVVGDLKTAGLAAASVSLNAHNQTVYDALCRPGDPGAYDAVKEFVRACVAAGIDTTVSVVDVPEVDRIEAASLAASLGARFRVRALVTGDEAAR